MSSIKLKDVSNDKKEDVIEVNNSIIPVEDDIDEVLSNIVEKINNKISK